MSETMARRTRTTGRGTEEPRKSGLVTVTETLTAGRGGSCTMSEEAKGGKRARSQDDY
jgi:hypothetical protein